MKRTNKPAKGKAVAVVVNNKKRSVGQKGVTPQPGTKKGNAYCARSAKIPKCANPPCAAFLECLAGVLALPPPPSVYVFIPLRCCLRYEVSSSPL